MAINFLRNFFSILSPAHFFYFMLYIHWIQWTFRCFICQYKIFSLIISIFVIFQYLSISFISIIRIVYQAKMLPQNYVAIFLLNRKIGISFWAGFEVLFGEFLRFQLLFPALFKLFGWVWGAVLEILGITAPQGPLAMLPTYGYCTL